MLKNAVQRLVGATAKDEEIRIVAIGPSGAGKTTLWINTIAPTMDAIPGAGATNEPSPTVIRDLPPTRFNIVAQLDGKVLSAMELHERFRMAAATVEKVVVKGTLMLHMRSPVKRIVRKQLRIVDFPGAYLSDTVDEHRKELREELQGADLLLILLPPELLFARQDQRTQDRALRIMLVIKDCINDVLGHAAKNPSARPPFIAVCFSKVDEYGMERVQTPRIISSRQQWRRARSMSNSSKTAFAEFLTSLDGGAGNPEAVTPGRLVEAAELLFTNILHQQNHQHVNGYLVAARPFDPAYDPWETRGFLQVFSDFAGHLEHYERGRALIPGALAAAALVGVAAASWFAAKESAGRSSILASFQEAIEREHLSQPLDGNAIRRTGEAWTPASERAVQDPLLARFLTLSWMNHRLSTLQGKFEEIQRLQPQGNLTTEALAKAIDAVHGEEFWRPEPRRHAEAASRPEPMSREDEVLNVVREALKTAEYRELAEAFRAQVEQRMRPLLALAAFCRALMGHDKSANGSGPVEASTRALDTPLVGTALESLVQACAEEDSSGVRFSSFLAVDSKGPLPLATRLAPRLLCWLAKDGRVYRALCKSLLVDQGSPHRVNYDKILTLLGGAASALPSHAYERQADGFVPWQQPLETLQKDGCALTLMWLYRDDKKEERQVVYLEQKKGVEGIDIARAGEKGPWQVNFAEPQKFFVDEIVVTMDAKELGTSVKVRIFFNSPLRPWLPALVDRLGIPLADKLALRRMGLNIEMRVVEIDGQQKDLSLPDHIRPRILGFLRDCFEHLHTGTYKVKTRVFTLGLGQ